MNCLSAFSFSKPRIIASLSDNTPPPAPAHSNPKPPVQNITTAAAAAATPPTAANHFHPKQKQQKQKQKQKQPSVAEIERVIGAGVFRDRDTTNRNSEQSRTLFDSILSNSIGKSEGSVERKLRETGEWVVDRTEKKSTSSGKNALMVVFWIAPMWIISFLIASGLIKLPFSIPFLDDLIM